MLIFIDLFLSLILMMLFIFTYILMEKIRSSKIIFSLKVYNYIKNIFEGFFYGLLIIFFQLILDAIKPPLILPLFMICGLTLFFVRNIIVGIFSLIIPLIYYLIVFPISWNFYLLLSLMILMFLSSEIINFFVKEFLINLTLINFFMFISLISVLIYDFLFNHKLTTETIEIVFMPFVSLMIVYYGIENAIRFLISANILYKSVNFNFSRYYRQSLKEVAIGEFIYENKPKIGIYGIFEINYKTLKSLEQNVEIKESILLDLETAFPENAVLFRADEKRYGFFIPVKQKPNFSISLAGNNLTSRIEYDLLKKIETLILKCSITYLTSWNERVNVKIKAGVAIYGIQDSSIDNLHNLADFSLKNQLSKQKNVVQLFNPREYFISLKEAKLINNMDAKIKLDNFINYFIPILDVKTKKTLFYVVTQEKVEHSDIKESPRDFINFFEWTDIFDRYMSFWALKNNKTQEKLAFYYSPTILQESFDFNHFVIRLNHVKTKLTNIILIFDYYMFKQIKNYHLFFKNLQLLKENGVEIGVVGTDLFSIKDLEKIAPKYYFIEDNNAIIEINKIIKSVQNCHLVAFNIKNRQHLNNVINFKVRYIGGELFNKSVAINNFDKQSKIYIYNQIKSRGEKND